MSVEQRVFLCRLLEKMKENGTYSNKLGLENVTTFHGIQIYDKNKGRMENL